VSILEDPALAAVSAEDLAAFHADGFVTVRRLISAGSVTALRTAFERLFRGEFRAGIRPDEVNWQAGESDPSLTRQICNGWKADPTVAAAVLDPGIGRAIARLGGWSGARLIQDNVIWKPPGARSLGYHRDNAYLAWYRPREMLSCWIALDETTADGGTMELVKGSHRWPVSDAPGGAFHAPEDYRAAMMDEATSLGLRPEIVPVTVPGGGGSFHHGWTWHGSGPNSGGSHRRSLVIHAAPAEAQFDKSRLGEGNGPVYGRYRRLCDDEMDENHFPILWREDGYRTIGESAAS